MPRHVRNFWIQATCDGAKSVTCGPKSATGGFGMTIKQRERGQVSTAFIIEGEWRDGTLTTTVFDRQGIIVSRATTQR